MYTKENLLVNKIAAKKSVKPELNCIAFYKNRTVATDSFRLMEVPTKDDVELADDIDMRLADTVKMPAGHVAIDEPIGYRVAGTYPDVDTVMERSGQGEFIELNLNGKLFGELLVQMSKMNKYGKVTVKVPTEKGRAIMLEAPYLKDKPAKGLMMPMAG